MSSTPAPSEDARPTTTMPTAVRVAVITMSLLAALLLLNAGVEWIAREAIVDRLVATQPELTREVVAQTIIINTLKDALLGLMLAVAAWFLPRRKGWARWLGLAATIIIGLLTLFSVLASGAASVPSLLVVVLAMAAITGLLSRTTSGWVPSLRSNG